MRIFIILLIVIPVCFLAGYVFGVIIGKISAQEEIEKLNVELKQLKEKNNE